jgi:hypothetical protein
MENVATRVTAGAAQIPGDIEHDAAREAGAAFEIGSASPQIRRNYAGLPIASPNLS